MAVLLSGGVDSSLALHLLHAAGHHVTAFYLQARVGVHCGSWGGWGATPPWHATYYFTSACLPRLQPLHAHPRPVCPALQSILPQIWFQEDFRNFWDACPWEEDLQYCRAVCDRLGVSGAAAPRRRRRLAWLLPAAGRAELTSPASVASLPALPPPQVELRVVPLSAQYWDRVVAHSIAEIRAGRTPNPDVLCNSRCVRVGVGTGGGGRHPSCRRLAWPHNAPAPACVCLPCCLPCCRVKFGAFLEELEKEGAGAAGAGSGAAAGFDRVASGHYARLERVPLSAAAAGAAGAGRGGEQAAQQQEQRVHGEARLALTPDAVKDQTYFLAHLSQAQLARTLFPLGHLTKPQASAGRLGLRARRDMLPGMVPRRPRANTHTHTHCALFPQVRALAAAADLPNKGRKDSQGICFLGKVKFSEFVK